MSQVPLSLGDFIVAYVSAALYFDENPPTPRPRNRLKASDVGIAVKGAARHGLNEIRRIRDSRRLPVGSNALKKRLIDSLYIRERRRRDGLRDPDPLANKAAPMRARYIDWCGSLVRSAFYNKDTRAPMAAGYKGLPRQRRTKRGSYYSTNSSLAINWIGAAESPWAAGGRDAYNHCGDYVVKLRHSWRREVCARGLANVEGRFVLYAQPATGHTHDVPHAECVYHAHWAECGRGHDLHTEIGLIVVAAGQATLVPYGSGGANAAFIRAAEIARRAAYRAHKAASRAGQEGGE